GKAGDVEQKGRGRGHENLARTAVTVFVRVGRHATGQQFRGHGDGYSLKTRVERGVDVLSRNLGWVRQRGPARRGGAEKGGEPCQQYENRQKTNHASRPTASIRAGSWQNRARD